MSKPTSLRKEKEKVLIGLGQEKEIMLQRYFSLLFLYSLGPHHNI